MIEEREMFKDNFPSNSKTQKATQPEPEKTQKVNKVVTGAVKQKKRSFSKRLASTFLEDDTKSVGNYLLYDILIPAAKSMISDMIGGGVEMLLFGERRRSNTSSSIRRDGSRSTINYNSMSRSSISNRDSRDISRTGRVRHDFDEIVLESRGEAEEVLANLVDLTIDYGSASVADLYDLVGITSNFTDNKYGWTDLKGASVVRIRDGYLISLPKTQVID